MKANETTKNEMLLQLSLLVKRIQSTSGGKTIQSINIDGVTGNLVVTYTDASQEDLGKVTGTKGEDGTGILDVQLYEDPLNPHDVFLQTTLTNGVVLRTRDSIAGFHGKSIADVYLQNNELHFVLDDPGSTELPPIPVANLTPVSVTGVRIQDSDLIFTLSDATEINVGVVNDLQGRGIADTKVEGGKLSVQYTDNPAWVEVANLDGVAAMAMVDGKLVYRKSSDPLVDIDLGAIVSITGARIDGNELILETNQIGAGAEINVGPVANLKGDAGVGISNVDIVSNDMVVTLTDATVINIPVTGLSPVHITGARYDAGLDEIIFTLSDTSEISSGIKEDMRGVGVADIALETNGDLNFYYTSDPLVPVKVGVIKEIVGYRVEGGKVLVNYNTDPAVDVEVGTLLGIANIVAQAGKFVVTYTNGVSVDIGSARAISDIVIDGNFNLIVNYTDGTSDAVGNLPKGETGTGYIGATVDPGTGDLLLSRSDGGTDNAGQVRLDIDNMIGSISSFTATASQSEFVVDHGGAVMCWVDSVLKAPDFTDLNLSDRVVFPTPFTGGELVHIISFAPTGTVITGYGIKTVTENPVGVFTIELENGNTHTINTVTVIPEEELPPGIASISVDGGGDLQVTLTDGTVINAGATSNALNIKTVAVDGSGDLIVTLSDDSTLNAGSVMSNLAISDVTIDGSGNLIVTMNSGGSFNAGQTANYVTGASIDPDTGKLMITLSDATVVDAGAVVNPLAGTEYEFAAFEGQTEFAVAHGGYIPLVWANAALLSKDSMVLTDPLKVVLNTPRKDQDVIRIILLSKGDLRAIGIESEATADDDTFYGKKAGVVGWYPATANKIGVPYDFVAGAGQTTFNNVDHSGEVEIYVDGSLMHDGYTTPARRVTLDNPLVGGEKVRITPLSAPDPMGNFLPTSYAKISNKVFTNGGSFISGKWVTRQFNNIDYNAISALLQNNRVILPAGTYYLRGWASVGPVHANAVRLFNATKSEVLLEGDAEFSSGNSRTGIDGYFTLSAQSAVVLQHKCVTTVATTGLGQIGNLGDPTAAQNALGVAACLASLEFWKVG